jgi:hypothetical protein
MSQAHYMFISHVHNPHDAIWTLYGIRASNYLTNVSDIEDCIWSVSQTLHAVGIVSMTFVLISAS